MSRALVVTEPGLDAGSLVALASGVAGDVQALVLVAEGESATAEPGASNTLAVGGEVLVTGEGAAEAIAAVVAQLGADVVLLPALHRYREIAALLTAHLGAASASDVTTVSRNADGLAVERLLYGGVVVATVQLQRSVAVLTSRVGARVAAGDAVAVTPAAASAPAGKQLLRRTPVVSEGDLSSAGRIVAFGRGVRSKDDMAMVDHLAGALGASIGCSRPIVDDLKWLPLSNQVGLTGTTVQPDLYVAVGISGQIQHLVGMRDSKFIVAINNNPAAPIFDASDLAVVGDLYEIVPKLAAAIAAR